MATLARSCTAAQRCSSGSLTAWALLSQVYQHNCAQSFQPVLDIFAPRLQWTKTSRTRSSRARVPSRARALPGERPWTSLTARSLHGMAYRDGSRQSQRRAFGTSRALGGASAKVLLNPRTDKHGREMAIQITPEASRRLQQIMTKDENPDLALRITVENGGCHGFQYLMSLETLPPITSQDRNIEDPPTDRAAASEPHASSTVTHIQQSNEAKTSAIDSAVEDEWFDEDAAADALDTVFEAADGTGARVVMDGSALKLLRGSKVHFTSELIGSQFKIVDNPLATSSCGCGTSFDAKLDLV